MTRLGMAMLVGVVVSSGSADSVHAADKAAPAAPQMAGEKAAPTAPPMATKPGAPMAPPVKPPAPPEVKKTVDAFAGNWKMDAMLTMPGAPAPMKVKAKLACKKVVAGKAVTCTMGGKIPGMPTYEAAVMIGYDVAGKAVHFMAMSTEDEVHDHRCVWKDEKSLVCDPLKGASMGQALTEELSFTFDGKTVVQRSVSTFADGSKVIFEGTAKK